MRPALLICCIGIGIQLSAQQDSAINTSKFELGLNVSNVLANFFNSDFPRAELEQYSLAGKQFSRKGRSAFRFHVGGNISNSDQGTGRFRGHDFRTKMGWEWHRSISQQFILIYGSDLLFNYSKNSQRNLLGSLTFTESTTVQGGPGLFIGLRYQLTRRLSLTTESSLSLIAGSRDRIVMENGTTVPFVNEHTLSLGHTLPVSLYVYFKL